MIFASVINTNFWANWLTDDESFGELPLSRLYCEVHWMLMCAPPACSSWCAHDCVRCLRLLSRAATLNRTRHQNLTALSLFCDSCTTEKSPCPQVWQFLHCDSRFVACSELETFWHFIKFFFSPRLPDRLWGSPNLLSNGCQGLFPRG
jgi:hypothetical protein